MSSDLILWLLTTIGLSVGLFYFHQRKSERGSNLDVEFSNITMFFDPWKGEGDIFVGGILILLSFSKFLLELAQAIRMIFIGM
ncbi:MAG: hypothetical protein HQM12_03645 [SAR324 cluster bacterium]|nr:hypothetical protein [SAR324 cluster bacterium]MBF0350072.1 hypothetical protein [SAR324 cluster bacterium]